MKKIFVPALAAIALATSPAMAEEAVSIQVGHAGLNLDSEAGMTLLVARVEAAAERACIRPNIREIKAMQAWSECKEAASTAALETIATVVLARR
jgi:UrcA family protein